MDEFVKNMTERGWSFNTTKEKRKGQHWITVEATKEGCTPLFGSGLTYENAVEHLRQHHVSNAIKEFAESRNIKYNLEA